MSNFSPDSDNPFLSWGSSVNVSEDLCRSVRKEIEEIDGAIADVRATVSTEDGTSKQLGKDLAHARNEMVNLGRGATDILDNGVMNENVRLRLTESFFADLVHGHSRQGGQDRVEDGGDQNGEIKEGASLTEENDEDPTVTSLNQVATELRDVSDEIAAEEALIDQLELEHDRLSREAETIRIRIAEEKFVEELDRLTKLLDNKLEEQREEERRNSDIQAAIHEARTKCGANAQSISDSVSARTVPYLQFVCSWRFDSYPKKGHALVTKNVVHDGGKLTTMGLLLTHSPIHSTIPSCFKPMCLFSGLTIHTQTKELTALKARNARERADFLQTLAKVEEELKSENDLPEIEAKIETAFRQLQGFTADLDAFHKAREACDAVVSDREVIEKALAEVSQAVTNRKVAMNEQQERTSAAVASMETTKADLSAHQARVKTASAARVAEMQAGKKELEELVKEKEEIARSVKQAVEAAEVDVADRRNAVKAEEAILVSINAQLEETNALLNKHTSKLGHDRELHQESVAATEKELKGLSELLDKLTAATKAEANRMAVLQTEHIAQRTERLEKARVDSGRRREAVERYLELLLMARDKVTEKQTLMDGVQDLERQYEELLGQGDGHDKGGDQKEDQQ